jgi:hypothetical protein
MESMLLTMITIFKATIASLDQLQSIGDTIQQSERSSKQEYQGVPSQDSCQELEALASLSQNCRSYMASVEVMQNRAAKLIDLVRRSMSERFAPSLLTLCL